MSRGTSGFERDVRLIRRRWWLFIPFLFVAVLMSFALARVTGDANAVGSMSLETVVHELFIGGDRGMRIFEADAMTADEAFKQKVITAAGDPELDYARYSIALSPISVADGVSRGTLTVSITDVDKAEARRLRDTWVNVFVQEYTARDGLFRTRYITTKQRVADAAEQVYQDAYRDLKNAANAQGLPIDELVRPDKMISVQDEQNVQIAALQGELARVQAAQKAIADSGLSGTPAAALASSALGQPVGAGDVTATLAAQKSALTEAIKNLRSQQQAVSDGALDPSIVPLLDAARAAAKNKEDAYIRLSNAQSAVVSADSTVEVTNSESGGAASSMVARMSIIVALTLVFGLIAIYALEWFAQVRAGAED